MGKGTASKNAEISIDDGGGHATVATTNLSPSDAFDTTETTELGDSAESHNTTIRRVAISGTGNYRPGAGTGQDQGQADMEDAYDAQTEVEVIYYPLGNSTGNPTYTFNALITEFAPTPGGPGDNVTFSFNLQLSDGTAPTRGTVA